MASKRTQRNTSRIHPSLSPPTSNHSRTLPEFSENPSKIAPFLPKKKVYITGVDNLIHPRVRSKTLSKVTANKLKDVYMPCRRHEKQAIKYVDITPNIFEGLCDVCMVRSEFFGKNMKLERLVELYNTKWEDLNKACEELKLIETKISRMHKEIVKENLKATPILKELDDMEKKVTKEVERSFRKIKAKFIKFNPFKDTRELAKNYLQEAITTLQELEAGTTESFEMLRSMYVDGNKIMGQVQNVIKDLNTKIEADKFNDPLLDKDFGILVYEYGRFFDKITNACTNFAANLKVSS